MPTHRCPPCCHRCPDADDQIIPGCLGTADNLPDEHGALTWCTCEAALPADADPATLVVLLTARIDAAERRLAALEARDC